MHLNPMYDLSVMEFPKVLFLDCTITLQFASVTSLYSSKHVVNFVTDDTTIQTSNSNLKKLSESLQESVNSVLQWAEFNYISLHPDKTKSMLITTRQKRQNLTFKYQPISIGNQTATAVNKH